MVNVDWFFASHRLPIAEAALRDGYEVHLACAVTGLKAQLEAKGIIVHELNINRRDSSPISTLRTVSDLLGLFRLVRPDIVHLVTIKPVLLGGIAARLTGVPKVIAAISGMGYVFIARGARATLRRLLVSYMYRLALRSNKVVTIFQNADDADLIGRNAELGAQQLRMIKGSGVDLRRFFPRHLPEGETVVTFAARLLKDKGAEEFVEAATLLRKQGVRARFIIAGDPDRDNPASIEFSQVEEWKRAGFVEVIGHQTDIPALFARSHIVVLPSYREGMPKVLQEAAACGRAVVTTDVPGCRDAIIQGQTGLMVPARTVVPLAEALKRIIDDREFCAALGEAGRRLAEREFDQNQVVQAHMSIYGEAKQQTR